MKTFSHSGDLGDILYSLPTVRALGGGHLILTNRVNTRAQMSLRSFNNLAPLLRCQPYLAKVSYCITPPTVDYDLDQFRAYWANNLCYGKSIAYFHAKTFGMDINLDTEPWLFVDKSRSVYTPFVVFARSTRYRSPDFPWKTVYNEYRKEAVFIGTHDEWLDFCTAVGPVKHYPTPDLREMARIIAACALFVGNQSCPYAIAEGLKKPVIQEVHVEDPNCLFKRPDAVYVAGDSVLLKKL